ncbi:MAG: hypothetical protein J6039_02535 [Alphaproteobacteria bacterium]|nr:hypothetical protein [Alphaproteobacteria bacterium]
MIMLLSCFICLIAGYFLVGKFAEDNYGIDIHRAPKTENMRGLLPYRAAQLAQFGLTFGIEGLFGAIVGIFYGPIMMIWCVISSIFLGSFLNYYCGMYAVTHGYSINRLILEKCGKGVYLLSTILLIGVLVVEFGVNATFFMNINAEIGFSRYIGYAILIVMAALSLYSQEKINIMAMVSGGVLLLVTLIFFLISLPNLMNLQYGFKALNAAQLKNAYPFLLFVVSVGALSGMAGLKSSLIGPFVKNEKMGKGVFFATTLLQCAVVLCWSFIIISWNSNTVQLSADFRSSLNPYTLLRNDLAIKMGYVAPYILFATVFLICVVSGVTILRTAQMLLEENRLFREFPRYCLQAIVIILGVIGFESSFGLDFYDFINQLTAAYLFLICTVLTSDKKPVSIHFSIAAAFVFGACISYFCNKYSLVGTHLSIASGLGLTVILSFIAVMFLRRR